MKWLLDLLYPPRCVVCRQGGAWWCARCRGDVERLQTTEGVLEGEHPFACVLATGFYHSPPLRRLIASLKYDGVTVAEGDVEAYLRETLLPLPWKDESSLTIIPMPLADSRERERGFNQASWIAARMKNAWNIPGVIRTDVLARRKTVAAQAELEHDAALRSANIRGAFQVIGSVTSPVLLVDDVVTTGSTAAEAARLLLDAGAPRVYLATLAVGK